ncbi:NAD(P)H-dependent oxidoreductase [Vibrio taketomensis]|uniref:NAD(P)H-dependent oxidoreductase n=1 Tax=Vibrio taketomensis TaxID=2572923 RepID=UPI001389BDBA|nr:NAD(P)H-dependent oxidoreductase [Vibrio taketomensis]
MSQVLVISGHPDLDSSYTNSVVLQLVSEQLDNVSVRRLDELYPDYQIDVAAEQQALIAADVVILQFPFYWYSVPALLKKWIDDVFSFNFAYGTHGDKLKGKDLILSFTIGGPAESYEPLGYNHFTIEQLIHPLQQTSYLAGMNFQKPIYSHRMVYIPNVYNELEDVQARATEHAQRLIASVRHLTESPEAKITALVKQWFAQFDQLAEDTAQYTRYLASDVQWQSPEGNFVGHQGFNDWYGIARATFKPSCQHNVHQLSIKKLGEQYQVDLHIRLIAETYPESMMQGQLVDMAVDETWLVSLDENGTLMIHSYDVRPVAEQ